MRHRILTVAGAGNDGPLEGMVANDAPWVLTVGAGTTDRRIAVSIKLGDGTELSGESAYQPSPFNSTTPFPLAFPKRGCSYDSFKGIDISGKIVLCESGFGIEENIEKGKIVKNAGGAAMVVLNRAEQGETTLSEAHVLPAAHVGYSARCSIESYFNSSTDSTPYVTLTFIGTILGARPSPAVASFSSRGPSSNNGGILKPDIIGPGVNILGAWPAGDLSATSDQESNFNFQSGTSSATPHLSGIAALLRSSHHHWSPSAIKSAIVTTATREDADGNPITDQFNVTTAAAAAASLFAVGAGQVDPSKANNPGLVYNLHSHSYKRYLCGLGYTDRQVTMITLHHAKCSRYRRELGPEQLNYPSITVALGSPARKTVRRWVRNVGEDSEVYVAKIDMPEGVKVEVYPPRLYFARRYDTRRFVVVLTADDRKLRSSGRVSEGQLLWVSSSHVVKSPIVVTFT
ncbi:Subtilisin-like protease SDD1 [Apostasia shenzhenica]|uniref:Subtilisin-like protease SDD1 n=1 Tax=Apostasia shenzhenica TaxID=1088818 RepID=A0A2I0A998_9ASPA|nr:Subtilisin-like protease SDD1 [Apostasia shenzhenica]